MTDQRFWNAFVESYVAREGFWHVPKQAVSRGTEGQLRQKLRILRSLEGRPWRPNQNRYARMLRARGLSSTREAPGAFSRVQKALFNVLGFSWVDEKGRVRITPTGREFLRGRRLEPLIRRQLLKFQFWNPGAVSKFKDFRLLPHIFLLQVLLRLRKTGISRDEYLLFICRATTHDDLGNVTELIRKYRKLGPRERENLRLRVKAKRAKKGRSPYRAAALDFAYAINFFGYPSYISCDADNIRIASGRLNEVKKIVREFSCSGIYINFRNEAEWLSFYGDTRAKNSVNYAGRYYEDISDVGSLVELLEECQTRGLLTEPKKEKAIREKILEDYLEYQPEKLEKGLVKVDRQFPTAVGPIDLLAKDKNGAYVVVELKKGRTSDRVLGQVLRYMAWVNENLRSKRPVRGIIVAEKVDRGLRYAMRVARNSRIGLKRYEFSVNFWDIT